MQDAIIEGNWMKGIWDHLFVMFLMTVCKLTIIAKVKKKESFKQSALRNHALDCKTPTH